MRDFGSSDITSFVTIGSPVDLRAYEIESQAAGFAGKGYRHYYYSDSRAWLQILLFFVALDAKSLKTDALKTLIFSQVSANIYVSD